MDSNVNKTEKVDNLRSFCESTSIPGLSYITSKDPKWLRIIWTGIVTVAFIGLLVHVTELMKQYFEYKTTQYTYEKKSGYNFPDVTFCNQNGISVSNLKQAAIKYPELRRYFNYLSKIYSPGYKPHQFPDKVELFHALGDIKASEIGHTFDDLVMLCEYRSLPCNKDDFELFQFDRLFNCYTFVKERKKKIKTQSVFSGLSLTLFMEPSIVDIPYHKFIVENTDGFKFALTPPESLPCMNVLGYEVPPGYSISMAFSLEETK